jgi:2-polyprenyl-3-methyl-5-hydroxy-6-metoxy-1,4-benzoquinol methylase
MLTFDPPFVRCLICNSDDIYEYHRDAKNIRIFRCRDCGVQFMNPQYTNQHLADYYSRYTKDEPEWDEALNYGHNFYLKILETYVPSKGALLDIGSGKGHLLAAALQRGWNAKGYEIDCTLAKELSSKLGAEIQCGDFPTLGWQDGQFDAVVMHHVLEHLKNPASYLQAIRTMLTEHGVLFLVLPNIHSLSSRVKFFLEKLHLRTKNVGAYYDTSHHLWYFTPRTLTQMLSRFGFDVHYMRSGHRVRPHQTRIKRFIMRNITEKNLLHSTFLCIAQKRSLHSSNEA